MDVRQVREATGMSFHEIRRGMLAMETDDPLLGACWAIVSGYAVNVRHGRDERNRRAALAEAERLRKELGA
jgi:hypothetical protein